MIEIPVAAPLDHQQDEDLSPARFKLYHHGRRWGKDRVAFKGAVAGHGPDRPDGSPMFPGAAQGWWIGWVVRDFTQGLGIWREEFLPRFEPLKPVVTVNLSELRVGLPNGGGIFMCTAKNVASLRGLGKRMKGLVVNEAAWFDLEEAWLAVLRALLVDNAGWAILMSTPNSGLDGNQGGVTPSYFNRLCHATYAGSQGPEWAVFGGDLRENPRINSAEADAFLRDLGPGTVRYEEEGLGRLVQSGAGLAFPSWSPAVHLVDWHDPPAEHALVLGMDWGIRSPAVITAYRVGPRKTLLAFKEWTWTDKDAYDAGYDFANALLDEEWPRWPEWMVADSAMNERTGVGGTTILSEFQSGINDALSQVRTPPLHVMAAPKGPGSRKAMFNQITKVLAWGPALADGSIPATRMPLLRIMKDRQGRPTCPMLAKDLATAVLHAKHQDEVDKDKSPSHALESLGYPLSLILPQADRVVADVPQDRHPGFLPTGQRRSRHRTPEVEAQEARLIREHQLDQAGIQPGSRYGRNPREPRRRT